MRVTTALLIAVSVLLVLGCTQAGPGPGPCGVGDLLVKLPGLGARTLSPDMDIHYYTITGNGPDADNFSINTAAQTTLIPHVQPGEWTVGVEAKNQADETIALGQQTLTVVADNANTVSIDLSPPSGTGALVLAISWPSGSIAMPVVQATLTPYGGSAAALVFDVDTDGAVYTASWVAAGYYTLTIGVLDDASRVWGTVESVRVVGGFTTNGAFDL